MQVKNQWMTYKITYILIAMNIVIYILTMALSGSIVDIPTKLLAEVGALFGPFTVLQHEWWRLGTAMFLHAGITHLLMNMFSLYLIGRGVETYFDAKSYIVLYLISGLFGGLVSLYMHPVSVGIGASGAIFGVFGALAGFFLAHRQKIEDHTKAFMKDFAIILGINLVLGFSIESIDVSAHIGGLVVGLIGGYVISKDKKWLWTYIVMMTVLMVAIASILPSQYATQTF